MTSAGDQFAQTASAIDQILRDAGYVRLDGLRIGDVPFEVQFSYLAGPGFLDLVLLMDVRDTPSQIYWLAERVANALDVAGSRRPLTYVLVGEVINEGFVVEELLRLGRVVQVTAVTHAADELAPLLPLVMEQGADVEEDPLDQVTAHGGSDIDASALNGLLQAARGGSRAVQDSLADWFDSAFSDRGTE